jgi:hypothetical protein
MMTFDDDMDLFGPVGDSDVLDLDERKFLPRNWRDTGLDPKMLFEIAKAGSHATASSCASRVERPAP